MLAYSQHSARYSGTGAGFLTFNPLLKHYRPRKSGDSPNTSDHQPTYRLQYCLYVGQYSSAPMCLLRPIDALSLVVLTMADEKMSKNAPQFVVSGLRMAMKCPYPTNRSLADPEVRKLRR